MAAFPPAPWRLRGRAALVAVPVRAAAARAAGLPPGARLLSAAGRTLGGLLLADYDDTATLRYRELIVFSGLAVLGARPAFVVSHIYVDSEPSLAGGRAIWGLPKERAEFTARGGRVHVRRADGVPLLAVRALTRGRRLPVPLLAPVLGTLDGRAARTSGLGRLRAAPGRAVVEVPAHSPLAALGAGGSWPAVAGDRLDLLFPAPNLGAMHASEIDPDVLPAPAPG